MSKREEEIKEDQYMKDIVEIRWHGRGGQGERLRRCCWRTPPSTPGKYVQGFPEYGPERIGRPHYCVQPRSLPSGASGALQHLPTPVMWWWWTRR